MSEFGLGKYQIEIASDRYESEEKSWDEYDYIEVKPKNNTHQRAIIFLGEMPDEGVDKLCNSKGMWLKLRIEWLHNRNEGARMSKSTEYGELDGWYNILANTVDYDANTAATTVRGIVRLLEGKDTLNFASEAHGDQGANEMNKFIEELVDTVIRDNQWLPSK